jgi:quinol monooxygenase YgiN
MILSTIRMTIRPQKRAEAIKILKSMADQCRDDLACLSCHIYADLQEKNVLMFKEIWMADEAMDLHIRSDEYRDLLLVLEMSLKQPEIRFDSISQSTGMETLPKTRSRDR